VKNHHHNGSIHPSSRSIIHETIATRAYDLWVGYGRPENQSDEIWMEAEREIIAGRNPRSPNNALPISF
jgi:hypothetical protein